MSAVSAGALSQPGASERIQARDRRGEQFRLVVDQVTEEDDQVQVLPLPQFPVDGGPCITQLGGIVDLGIADECHPQQG